MAKVKLGRDLQKGDVIAMGDNGKRNVKTTVLATEALAAPDLFGRTFDAVWARREDTGAEGLVPYGPEGAFVLWDDDEQAPLAPVAVPEEGSTTT